MEGVLDMTINKFQNWTKENDKASQWNILTTLQCLSHLVEEVGELAQSINRVYEYRGEVQKKYRENLRQELVDTAWFLVKIANRFDINLEDEIAEFVSRANNWPLEKHHDKLINGLMTLDKELSSARREIKTK